MHTTYFERVTIWIKGDGKLSPSLNTSLKLLGKAKIPSKKDLSCEVTIARQCSGSNLATRMMDTITPVNICPACIKGMNSLVDECIGGMCLGGEMVGTEENAAVVLETTGELAVAATAFHLGGGELAAAAF